VKQGFLIAAMVAIAAGFAPSPSSHAEQSYDPVTAAFIGVGPGTPAPLGPMGSLSDIGLYGVEIAADDLLAISTLTGLPTVVGTVGSPTVAGLSFDVTIGRLFGTDTHTRDLILIDPGSGSTTVVGATGVPLLHGLAVDPASGSVYACDADGSGPSNLWKLDRSSGAAVLIGPIGFNSIAGLDFDPNTGVLYGSRSGSDAAGFLITINPTSGAGTFVGNSVRLGGLAFDSNGQLFGVDNGGVTDGVSRLYRLEKATGAAVLIGPIVRGFVLGMDFVTTQAVPVRSVTWGRVKALYL